MNPTTYSDRETANSEVDPRRDYSSLVSSGGPLDEDGTTSGRSAEVVLGLWRERRFLFKAFVSGLLVAAFISLIIRPEYQSTVRIMPPQKQGLGGLAAMLAAGGDDKAGSLVGGLISSATGLGSSGALCIGVLKSDTIRDQMINEFNLRRIYGKHYEADARQELSDRTELDEDRKSGIISITVRDRVPQRSMQMAQAYADNLGSLMASLDTSAAHRERVFLEGRLQQVKESLDADSKALSDYSSKNLTLDVKEQGKAMMTGAVALEGELVATETELSGLEQIYSTNNVRVKGMQARVDELKRKLAEIKGNADTPEADGGGEFGVSIAHLPAVGLAFTDLYRNAKIQEAVFETLTKQYELAKIEEAKSVPTIKILDPPLVPEKKTSPKRTLISLFGGFFTALLAAIYVILSEQWRNLSISHPLNVLNTEVRAGVQQDLAWLRDHCPRVLHRLISRIFGRARHETLEPPA